MEEDVSRAIKQLESIAIKAMKSGYLDDAAKVMHIAEEIERVDQKGIGAEAMVGAENELAGAAAHEPADEPTEESGEHLSDALESADQPSFDSTARNVVPLNRFRMKRSAAVGDDLPESEGD
ncbi:MAG: hypothetical protein HYX67_11845 [Candidatus Melainabacteria bacterium]|nr:hypothetical protein [Candidatus Melainabacteria bacterium]